MKKRFNVLTMTKAKREDEKQKNEKYSTLNLMCSVRDEVIKQSAHEYLGKR